MIYKHIKILETESINERKVALITTGGGAPPVEQSYYLFLCSTLPESTDVPLMVEQRTRDSQE